MPNESIARLQAELEQLTGEARMSHLIRLGQLMMAEYTNIGQGTPAAQSQLNASIEAFDEAYGYLQAGDPVRGQVAALLGFQLSARYGAHGGSAGDCQTGIHVLEEALAFPSLPATQRAMSQIALGQLYLGRVSAYMQTPGFGMQIRGASTASAQSTADADRAIECFRAILDGEPISDELTTVARTLMELAETVRAMLGGISGGLVGMDLGRMSSFLALMQKFQEQMKQGGQPGYRLPASGFFPGGAEALVALDPLDRPVAVVQGKADSAGPAPKVVQQAPVAPPDAGELRRSLCALLPERGDGTVWLAAAELLLPGTPTPSTATVDEMVALAYAIVEQPPGEDRAQTALDSYLLAIALLLRDRADEASDGADRRAGAEELLAAAKAIPAGHPAAIVVLRSLGAFLSETRPLDGVVEAIAGGFADRLDSALAGGVTEPAELVALHALRCVCRAAEALADLRRAAGAVPADYPWLAPLKAASQLAGSSTIS